MLSLLLFTCLNLGLPSPHSRDTPPINPINALTPDTPVTVLPIKFQSGDAALSGKIITRATGKKKVPLLIFINGSGPEPYQANYASFLQYFLEDNLPLEDIALLYFNKRGVGGSEGKWYDSDFLERAKDVRAAADYAKQLPYIDPNRILVVGHSQGGWITQLCLANYPEIFAGGLSLAGPTFSVKKQLVNDYAQAMACESGSTIEETRKKAEKKASKDLLFVKAFPTKEKWKQLKRIANFDPKPYLQLIEKPLLVVFAENDMLVNPNWGLGELQRSFPNGIPKNIQTITIKNTDHSFRESKPCETNTRNNPYSQECKNLIRSWVTTFR